MRDLIDKLVKINEDVRVDMLENMLEDLQKIRIQLRDVEEYDKNALDLKDDFTAIYRETENLEEAIRNLGREFQRLGIKEGLGELAQMVEKDHEVQMARSELYKAAKYAVSIHGMLRKVSEMEGIDGWVASKITKAADYLGSVKHYLEGHEMAGPENALDIVVTKAQPDIEEEHVEEDKKTVKENYLKYFLGNPAMYKMFSDVDKGMTEEEFNKKYPRRKGEYAKIKKEIADMNESKQMNEEDKKTVKEGFMPEMFSGKLDDGTEYTASIDMEEEVGMIPTIETINGKPASEASEETQEACLQDAREEIANSDIDVPTEDMKVGQSSMKYANPKRDDEIGKIIKGIEMGMNRPNMKKPEVKKQPMAPMSPMNPVTQRKQMNKMALANSKFSDWGKK
tara:strand:+ start:2381 stop:3568 length:1188 start_codon:yes stop_codon:yes gene_type:complete